MQSPLKRAELDRLANFYSLDPSRIDTMLDLARARPSREDGLAFLGACLLIGGLLSLAAALVFFVAANWSAIGIFGRFALVEAVLVACAAVAIAKPPPSAAGRGAAFLVLVSIGALLALFGQTYQTGADVYELFLGWALLALPLPLIARWSVVTAAWILVFDLALALYCGWQPAGGLLWVLFGSSLMAPATALVIAGALNVAMWFVAVRGTGRWCDDAAPEWVRRLVLSCASGFVTWSGIFAVLHEGGGASPAIALAGVVALMTAVGFEAMRRQDVYALAVLLGTFILVSLFAVGRALEFDDEFAFFVLAAWLILTSTIGGRLLMAQLRRWRQIETPAVEA